MNYHREVSLIWIPGTKFLKIHTDNHFGSVSFDFFETWDAFIRLQEKPPCIIMLHSHPPGVNDMSSIDVNMVQGWRTAFGVPIFYGILRCDLEDISFWICNKDGIFEFGQMGWGKDIIPELLTFLSLTETRIYDDVLISAEKLCQIDLQYLESLLPGYFTPIESAERSELPMESTV